MASRYIPACPERAVGLDCICGALKAVAVIKAKEINADIDGHAVQTGTYSHDSAVLKPAHIHEAACGAAADFRNDWIVWRLARH
ncbi:hypothetical protein [Pseudomonas sp. UBA4102]|uniref:hypothetical protein n=1 Tax=Pseudomonas sp. UBA4102 TaxID=1947316 RepID=UPI00257FDF70|nr:hypothetical protein [Pseudomonas sp. UBA4102]